MTRLKIMAGRNGKPIAGGSSARAWTLFGSIAAVLRTRLAVRNVSGLPRLDPEDLPEHLSRDLGFRDGRTIYRENEPWSR
jgi:hypothetical protein